MAALLPTILHLLIVFGVPALLAGLIVKLPPVNVHLKNAALTWLVNTIGNIAESVLKTALTGQDIEGVFTAWQAGTPLRNILSGLLPELLASVKQQIGPFLTLLLTKLIGGSDAANEVIVSKLLSVAHDVLAAKQAAGHTPLPGQVVKLESGRLLVVPHGQTPPASSTPVATLAKAA